jgi:signal transduction histidine kinase
MSFRADQPPYAGRELQRQTALFDSISLWALVMAALVGGLYLTLYLFQLYEQFLWLSGLTVVAIAACLLARVLARRGRLTLGVAVALFGLLMIMSVSVLLLEGIVHISASWYVAMIVLTGLLLGPRASLFVAATCAMLFLMISVLNEWVVVAALELPKGWSIAILSFVSTLTFFFVAFLGRLSTQDLRRALDDATYDLVQANQELQEANRLKNRFLARVSHELRTPLNAIIGYTDMNLAGYYGTLNDAQTDALERVQRNGRQLLLLINDVLDLSRIDAQGVELEGRAFSPQDLVLSVVSTVEPSVRAKGLDLTYDMAPELPQTLVGDQVRLSQVLTNLVDNAVKFTDEGGIHISALGGNEDTWVLMVRDTGRGISERDLPRIFEEFHQGSPVYGRQSEGVGLGLAIAHRLVMAMGGDIRVQSRLGAGSTFTVILPTTMPAQKNEEAS